MDYSHALKKLAACLVAIIVSNDYTSQLRYGGVHAQDLIDIFAKVYFIMFNKSIMHNKSVTLSSVNARPELLLLVIRLRNKIFFLKIFLNSHYLA